MLYGKLGVDFLSTFELLYPNMKNMLRLIGARTSFYMVSFNPNVSLGIVDCSLYSRRIALSDNHHYKRMDMLAYAPVKNNYWETVPKIFIFTTRQNQFILENFFTMLKLIRLPLQWIQTVHSLDCALNIHSDVSNLMSDKSEYSK